MLIGKQCNLFIFILKSAEQIVNLIFLRRIFIFLFYIFLFYFILTKISIMQLILNSNCEYSEA